MSITPREPADFTPTRGNFTELKPFRFWCQKVLPLVYDDSLSYYELLCKVVDFLNKTMEDVETLEDDVTNIYDAYNELQDYVNSYFSSLDVQKEIDTKLDEMASDGSLTELIVPLLPDLVSAWLREHLTPTTPTIDNTLTVSGAGADAKVTGDFIRDLDDNIIKVSKREPLNSIKDINCNNVENVVITNGAYITGYNTTTKLPIITLTEYHPDWTVFDFPIDILFTLNVTDVIIANYESYSPVNKIVFYKENENAQNYSSGTYSIKNFNRLYDRVCVAFDNKYGLLDVLQTNIENVDRNKIIASVDNSYIRYDSMFETGRGVYGKNYLDFNAISYAKIVCPSDYIIVIDNTWKNHVSEHTRHIEIRVYDAKTLALVTQLLNVTLNNEGNADPDFIENFTAFNYQRNIYLDIDVNWNYINNNFEHAMFADKAIIYSDYNEKANEILYNKSIPYADTVDFSYLYRNEARNVFSPNYNVSTLLPNETAHTEYLTYLIDIPKYGEIRFPYTYIDDGSTSAVQAYTLNDEHKITANINIATYENQRPDSRREGSHGFFREPTYMGLDCNVANNLGDKYLYVTLYSKNRENYILPIDAYVPEWFSSSNFMLSDESMKDAEIVLPSKLVIGTTREMNIYYQNICRFFNPKDSYGVEVVSNLFADYGYFARYTPTSLENTNMTFRFYPDRYDKSISKTMDVKTVSKNLGSGLTRKVMFIGDSLTDADSYTAELLNMFSSGGMTLQLIGTLGTAPNLNEGRSGWRAYTYCRCANNAEDWATWGGTVSEIVTNPFYNSSTHKFDFSMYMHDNGFDSVDYVFICLGVNDIERGNHQSVQDLTTYYNEMINSIHTYNANIKIGLWLPPTRALYPNALERKRIDNSLWMNKFFIETYDNRENELIYLVPIYLNLDPYHDYPFTSGNISARNSLFTMNYINDFVHPSQVGYNKIADVIYSYLKYFVSLE